MTKRFSKGDRVAWNSHGSRRGGGKAIGTVLRRLTAPLKINGHRAKASPEHPQYLVRSDHGGVAAHRPDALERE